MDAKEDLTVINEHRVVAPTSLIRRDALMAGVGDGRSKASNFSCRGFGWKCDFVSKSSWELLWVCDVSKTAAQLGKDLEKGRQARTAKNHSNGDDEEFHEDMSKEDAGVIDALKDGNGSACKWM
jgi:hypothetical protein